MIILVYFILSCFYYLFIRRCILLVFVFFPLLYNWNLWNDSALKYKKKRNLYFKLFALFSIKVPKPFSSNISSIFKSILVFYGWNGLV